MFPESTNILGNFSWGWTQNRTVLQVDDMDATIRTRAWHIASFRVLGLVAALTIGAQYASAQTDSAPLLLENDLVYEGAFRVPDVGSDGSSFAYGGTGIGFNPVSNSLFLTGHKNYQLSAEISIPTPVDSGNYNSLPTATLLQSFRDATEGRLSSIDPGENNGIRIGGHLVFGNRLYVTAYSYYDANGSQSNSHFSRPLSLSSSGQVDGAVRVGSNAHYTSGYMALVPPEWQSEFGGPALTGNCCRSIISHHSHGPAVSVFNPASIDSGNDIGAVELLRYTSDNPLGPGEQTQNPYFNLNTRVEGVVFPNGTRSVLFFGEHGIGPYCYGDGAQCGDPADESKGNHAYPYVYQVWAYDANDLLRVKNGTLQPHAVEPYDVWVLNPPLEPSGVHETGGATYDPSTGRIFFVQMKYGSSNMPVIHVYRVDLGPRPLSPTNLTVE